MLDAPCGDFNWMKEVHKDIELYNGIDIVEDIIGKNKKKYSTKIVQFYQSDITRDPLPTSDLILYRDCVVLFVFQILVWH